MDYEPATDILSVDMPSVNDIFLPELIRSMSLVVAYLRHYDVKRLLIDARKTQVEVSEVQYADMLSGFRCGLAKTRLEKMARIIPATAVTDTLILQLYRESRHNYELEHFTALDAALKWLSH